MLLKVTDLSLGLKSNPKATLVTNVSFDIRKGETLGIVGESGSGKTLTAMSVAGLLPPAVIVSGGEIQIIDNQKETDLLHAPDVLWQQIRGQIISVVFQEPMSSLNPSMRCGRQVAEMVRAHQKLTHKETKERVLELFNEVGLPDPVKAMHSYPFQLSGGQQQRVMIAMAIANNPGFIIADEPTTALDMLVQNRIILLLKGLQKKYGMGIIFISHDIDLVAAICDRIMVMRHGRVVEEGTANDIMQHPTAPYTAGLIKCKPRLDTPKGRLLVATGNDSPKHDLTEVKPGYDSKPLLEIKDINIYYNTGQSFFGKPNKSFQAVKKMSLALYKHETLGIVGGSGSGKSTLGKAIIGLVDRMEGNIFYNGERVETMKPSEFRKLRRKIQMVFQDPYSSLNPKMRVGSAISEVLSLHNPTYGAKKVRHEAETLLGDVKLESYFYYRYPHQLSGGQRQRVAIARALATNPELLICDESVSALDVSIQADVLNLLNELKIKKGLSYIFISHDLAVVKYMSDRIIVMHEGEMAEMNSADALFESPGHEYTKSLMEAQRYIL